MAIEATVSIAYGDNPRLLPLKLAPIYTTDTSSSYRGVEGTVELVLERLKQTPATSMSLDEITELYADIAWIARIASAVQDDGLAVFSQIAEVVDDEQMARGLRLLAEKVRRLRPVDDELKAVIHGIMEEMEQAVPAGLAQIKLRYDLVCEGLLAIAGGCDAHELERVLDGVKVEEEVRIYR